MLGSASNSAPSTAITSSTFSLSRHELAIRKAHAVLHGCITLLVIAHRRFAELTGSQPERMRREDRPSKFYVIPANLRLPGHFGPRSRTFLSVVVLPSREAADTVTACATAGFAVADAYEDGALERGRCAWSGSCRFAGCADLWSDGREPRSFGPARGATCVPRYASRSSARGNTDESGHEPVRRFFPLR